MPADPSATPLVFEAIGTRWQVDSPRSLDDGLVARIRDTIAGFDRVWSRFRSDSMVADIARAAGSRDLGPDAGPLFALYRRLYDVTAGEVTPFVGDALGRLGYDAGYSLLAGDGPRAGAPDWNEIAVVDGSVLTTSVPVTVDIGAAGKGYLVDLVAALLTHAGHDAFTVDASGDLVHRGPPIRVALEHPYDSRRAIGVVPLAGGALCASATNRRVWGNGLHHVLHGRTGEPVNEVVATWATAPDAATADGVATALFFEQPARLAAEFGAEGVRMFTNGRIERSQGFPGEIFR